MSPDPSKRPNALTVIQDLNVLFKQEALKETKATISADCNKYKEHTKMLQRRRWSFSEVIFSIDNETNDHIKPFSTDATQEFILKKEIEIISKQIISLSHRKSQLEQELSEIKN